tara:strand:+ start:727 stop:1977 length:1251 start_codon:yes stop_codon:yes gene_type:complete
MRNPDINSTTNPSNLNLRRKLTVAGHFLFFGSIFFLFNPFFAIETIPRFGGFGILIAAGTLLSIIANPEFDKRVFFWIFLFNIVYIISILRVNYIGLNSNLEEDGSVLEAILTALLISASMLMTGSLNVKVLKNALVIIGVPISFWFTLHYKELFDYTLRDSFQLGVIDYNSYQIVSQILAITVISCLSSINLVEKYTIRNIILIIMSFVFLFGMSQGLARGEYVALVFSISILIFGPKLSILVIGAIYVCLPFIFSVIDLPIIDRLLEVEQGDYGTRDYLFRSGFEAIVSDSTIFLIGGGLNHFQNLMNLPLESFPHNIFLESWISGGILFFIVMISIYITPIFKAALLIRLDLDQKFLLALCVFCALIGMKSGTIVSPWLIGLFSCCYLKLKFAPIQRQLGHKELDRSARIQSV